MCCFINILLAPGEAVFILQNRCFYVGFCPAEQPYFIFLLSAEALPSCLFRGFQGLAGVLLCCACCHGAPRCRLIAARNSLAVSTVAALRNFTEPPVNFLRLPWSIATGQLENFSSYAVALLRDCWRKITDAVVMSRNSRIWRQKRLWRQIICCWRGACKDVSAHSLSLTCSSRSVCCLLSICCKPDDMWLRSK